MSTRLRILLFSVAALGLAAPALAQPQGPAVVTGTATVTGVGTATTTVTQTTQNAIINWHTFNLGPGTTARFVQPGTTAATLNRVTGGLGPSQIHGTIDANGRVFLINRDGILFGGGAVVNTSGFLATTHDITNADFMAGRYNFNIPGRPDASIVNLGTITAHNGGFAALVAPGVRNSGIITAELGTVALAAGNTFTLDLYGDRLIRLGVADEIAATVMDVQTGLPLKSLVANEGKLKANGGRVEITAAAARTIVDSVINNTGVIEANTVGVRKGMIVLGAATAKTKPAGLPKQVVKVSGTITATGTREPGTTTTDGSPAGGVGTVSTPGGTVVITGEHIALAGATIDVSGPAGGGAVMIGGDWAGGNPTAGLITNASAVLAPFVIPTATSVTIDGATIINASATERGNGGKVVVWADGTTSFAGTILAQGGRVAGDGGFVEVSGKETLNFAGAVDTGAPAGRAGTLLLDPLDFTIWSGIGLAPAGSSIVNTVLQALLAIQNVVITNQPGAGNGDIIVAAQVLWSSSTTLTLSAFRNIQLNFLGAGPTISNTGAGHLVLRADNTGTGTGTLILDGGTSATRIDWTGSTGKVTVYYNPASYELPGDFTNVSLNGRIAASASQYAEFMLVNSVANLAAIGQSTSALGRTYALGRDIDASTLTAPIGGTSPFTGKLEGLGHTISNATITSTNPNVGLFARIGSTGIVQNLTLANFTINAGANFQNIGTVAGRNEGQIRNVVTTGFVNGANFSGVVAGVVAGFNSGLIADTSAFGLVIGATAGGLVGENFGGTIERVLAFSVVIASEVGGGLVASNTGQITFGAAHGVVIGGDGAIVGGFVGTNFLGTIQFGFAGGPVFAAAGSLAGGFAGVNAGTLNQVIAFGNVFGGANSFVGGLVGFNLGLTGFPIGVIQYAYAIGSVTGGPNSFVAGLVALNLGTIEQTYAAGRVSGGPGSTTGGLVAINDPAAFFLTLPAAAPAAQGPVAFTLPTGFAGTVTNSFWDTSTTGQTTSDGGTGMTTAQMTNGLPPGFDPAVWTPGQPNNNYPYLTAQSGYVPPPGPGGNQQQPSLLNQIQSNNEIVTAALTQDPVVTTQPTTTPRQPRTQQPQQPLRPNGEPSGLPPLNETRFIKDEVVIQIASSIPAEQLNAILRQLGLTTIASESIALAGTRALRLRITNRQTVRSVILALERNNVVAFAGPNYQYRLAQGTPAAPAGATTQPTAPTPQAVTPTGPVQYDPAQYVVGKLRLPDTHRLARGNNVLVAVIDSAIDTKHPDLAGTIVETFDALGEAEKPETHGTGMAGAIVSRQRLVGVAPAARILAVRAFSANGGGTTFQILKGLDWAIGKGARIVNMSFAGPRDPMLEKAFKTVREKGVILIAAAGNAGVKSPPLYPGADPSVIAVTATDPDDKLFSGANRGKYITVAAPGVDILVPAPEGAYQVTTGTSVAAAHVSGIVALLLERNPSLSPDAIRSALTATAKPLGPKGHNPLFGAGLVDPYQAILSLDQKPPGTR